MSAAIDITDVRTMLDRCRVDPAFFVREVLGAEAWQTQIDIMESVRDHDVTAVPSCHSSGKSWVAARIALWFLFSHHGSRVITTAPTRRQVEGILWMEIASAHRDALVPLGGEMLSTELKIEPDWYAIGFTAPDYDPNRFQGFHAPHILVIVDEAAGVTGPIMAQITSLLAGGHARLLQIGNPVEAGSPFHHTCRNKLGNVIPISAFDTPNFTKHGITEDDILTGAWMEKQGGVHAEPYNPHLISPRWVAQRFAEWGAESDNWKSRVLGQFPDVVQGSYYGELIKQAREAGRIDLDLDPDPMYPVHTAWDIGFGDKTAIWWYQQVGNQLRLLDFYEHQGVGILHYKHVIDSMDWWTRDLRYGTHWGPHDIASGEWGSGKLRIEQAAEMGIEFDVVPHLGPGAVEHGIEAVRNVLPRAWFHRRCEKGVQALESYHRERNPRTGEFRNKPEHDWASDGADAFRYLAVSLSDPVEPNPRVPRFEPRPGGFMTR